MAKAGTTALAESRNMKGSWMIHEAIAAALADRSRLVDGKPTSLLDLGFDRIGMDDNWQACGAGINGSSSCFRVFT